MIGFSQLEEREDSAKPLINVWHLNPISDFFPHNSREAINCH